MSIRDNVRAITDALPKGEWLRVRAIFDRLPEPKPSFSALCVTVSQMAEDDMLDRRGEKKRYEYRSGPEAVRDRRHENRGTLRFRMGFRALARLETENPAEWARLTEGGTR